MPFEREVHDGEATVHLQGRLTFSTHADLRSAVVPLIGDAAIKTIRLNLEEVAYVDSSTLGLFLLFREQAWVVHKSLVVSNPNPSVLSVLKMLRLEALFEAEG